MNVDRYEVHADRVRIWVTVGQRPAPVHRSDPDAATVGQAVIPGHNIAFIESTGPFEVFSINGGTFQLGDVPELIDALERIAQMGSSSVRPVE